MATLSYLENTAKSSFHYYKSFPGIFKLQTAQSRFAIPTQYEVKPASVKSKIFVENLSNQKCSSPHFLTVGFSTIPNRLFISEWNLTSCIISGHLPLFYYFNVKG